MPCRNPPRVALSDQTNVLNMEKVDKTSEAVFQPRKESVVGKNNAIKTGKLSKINYKNKAVSSDEVKLKNLKVGLTNIGSQNTTENRRRCLQVALSDVCALETGREKRAKSAKKTTSQSFETKSAENMTKPGENQLKNLKVVLSDVCALEKRALNNGHGREKAAGTSKSVKLMRRSKSAEIPKGNKKRAKNPAENQLRTLKVALRDFCAFEESANYAEILEESDEGKENATKPIENQLKILKVSLENGHGREKPATTVVSRRRRSKSAEILLAVSDEDRENTIKTVENERKNLKVALTDVFAPGLEKPASKGASEISEGNKENSKNKPRSLKVVLSDICPVEKKTLSTRHKRGRQTPKSVESRNRSKSAAVSKEDTQSLQNKVPEPIEPIELIAEGATKEKKIVPAVNNARTKVKQHAVESILKIAPHKNLRKLQPKNYEESLIESPKPVKKDNVPIYKKNLPETQVQTSDQYEFTDTSPKPKKIKRRLNRSTIFDKNTHEIVRRLEKKEATTRKNKKKKPVKSYEETINEIVKKVNEKVKNRLANPKINIIRDIKIQAPPKTVHNPKPLPEISEDPQSIERCDNSINGSIISCDNSINDIEHCFGFDGEEVQPNIHSPVEFSVRKPNANSTMLMPQVTLASPWRTNLKMKTNTILVKKNSLPRLSQDLILDHTIADKFVGRTIQTTPAIREPVQQSILNFIDSNVEVNQENNHRSLYDYEAFESPKKKKFKSRLLDEPIISSTPLKRVPLLDISNTVTVKCFGFDTSSPGNLQQNEAPWRVDMNVLKKYVKKNKEIQTPEPIPDTSISIMEASNEQEEVHLFEEPDEMLDRMSPVVLSKKKPRRKRLMSFEDSALEERKKKHKKTACDIEMEEWVARLNAEHQQIDQSTLEIE